MKYSTFLIVMSLSLFSCANNETDSDEIVNEFKQAGQKVGSGIKKGANAVGKSVCETFGDNPDSCED